MTAILFLPGVRSEFGDEMAVEVGVFEGPRCIALAVEHADEPQPLL